MKVITHTHREVKRLEIPGIAENRGFSLGFIIVVVCFQKKKKQKYAERFHNLSIGMEL